MVLKAAAPASACAEAASGPRRGCRGDRGALTAASASPQVHACSQPRAAQPPAPSCPAPASALPRPPHSPCDPNVSATPRSAEGRTRLLPPAPELRSGVHFVHCSELDSGRNHFLLSDQRPMSCSSGAPKRGPAGPPGPTCFLSGTHTSLQKPRGTISSGWGTRESRAPQPVQGGVTGPSDAVLPSLGWDQVTPC